MIAALALVGLAAWGIMRAMSAPEAVAVPDVSGMSVEEATQALEDDGFTVASEVLEQEAEQAGDPNIGNVVAQDPPAGEEAEEGTEVTLTVLVEPAEVEVTDVVGQDFESAEAALVEDGFTVVRETRSSTEPPNTVLEQNPQGGTMAEAGSEVTLTVSEGGVVVVPDVTGSTEQKAGETLGEAGLDMAVEYVIDGDTPGVVDSQDISPGSEVDEGTTVTVYVTGVVIEWDEATTPQQLQSQLENDGLTVTIAGDPEGTVIESVSGPDGDVTSGNVVAPGSEVTINATTEDDGGGGGDDTTSPDCNPVLENCETEEAN